jgi:hypothetical protein
MEQLIKAKVMLEMCDKLLKEVKIILNEDSTVNSFSTMAIVEVDHALESVGDSITDLSRHIKQLQDPLRGIK